ncbi:MAG: hypothetical protein A2X64_08095 [Ignavibacteria bacterium GWF2_33_9]|nr:MAG: hypothetical protein A2X64_08095 [Ignavibacteria bacterium GWF2_33_9]
MNTNIIKRVIADQSAELSSYSDKSFVERDLLPFARNFLDEKIIKVITGVRRCGKSTFCRQILEGKEFAYFNFDDERLVGIGADDLDQILEILHLEYRDFKFIFFDEIQNVPGWELFVNRLQRQGYNIIITGSNSKMLSRELATHLTGRHIQIELLPFSFKEFLTARNLKFDSNKSLSTKNIAEINVFLNEFIETGSFPEIHTFENKKYYLRDLFDKIILRDIVERHRIREINTLKELAIVLLNYYGSLFTYNKLSNSLQIKSVNTVKEFAGYLEDTYLLSYVNKYSFKIQEEIRSPRKVYSIDTGLITALGTSLSPNFGRKMENIVYLNERRKGNKINYFNDVTCEVDFVITNPQNEINLIQVSKDISNPDTLKRELAALQRALSVLQAKKIILINEDKEETIQYGNSEIEVVPLWKYLLQ